MSPTAHDGVGEDRVPVAEGEIGREHDRLLLVAARDDLEEEVGGVRVVGEVADLVDGQHVRAACSAAGGARGRARSPAH